MKITKVHLVLSLIGAGGGTFLLYRDFVGGRQYTGKELCLGKTVIITGANTGIGKETAKVLGLRGGRVILACRDMKKCEETRKELVEETVNKQIICKELDLASMESIKKFADDINKS